MIGSAVSRLTMSEIMNVFRHVASRNQRIDRRSFEKAFSHLLERAQASILREQAAAGLYGRGCH